MIALFHRAKHWQLFVLLIGVIAIFQVSFMLSMTNSFSSVDFIHRRPNFSHFFWFFIPMILFSMVMTFGWQWSVGSGLKHRLPRGVRMNFKLYRAFTIVPILYILLYLCFIVFVFTRMENLVTTGNPFVAFEMVFPIMLGMIILLPLGIFATFCMFYNYYFCAKTLKSIELSREAELNDYIGYFFLFWFNIVGFWIVQPSVNHITSGSWTPPPTPPGYEPMMNPDPTFDPIPEKEYIPPGEKLKTRNHEAFDHDDDFEGLF